MQPDEPDELSGALSGAPQSRPKAEIPASPGNTPRLWCLPTNPAAMALQIGEPAPDFTLPDANGSQVRLQDLRGQRVVIYFYPKDDTPGCTKEACNFRDRWSVFEENGIKVLGISKDGAASHGKFIGKYDLPFTLLTDAEPCPVATAFESYGLKKFMGKEYMGMMRHTFVVDPEGRLEKIYLKVKAEEMADQVLSDLGLG